MSTSTAATNITLNAGTTGQVQIGGTSTGDILLGGGSGSTGCTLTNSTGAYACTSTVSGSQLISTVATGTAPLTVASTTKVANLNVDLLDGLDSTGFILNQTSQQASSNFNISGAGVVGSNFTVNGNTLLKTTTNSTTALQVQNAAGENALTVDTTTSYVTIGRGTSEATVTVSGGTTGSQRVSFASGGNVTWSTGAIGGTANPSYQIQRYNAGAYVDAPITINNTTGDIVFKKSANNTTAFSVQNAAGTNILQVDTAGAEVTTATFMNVGQTSTQRIRFTSGATSHGVEIGRTDSTASTPYLDFHSGATATDYDSRILATQGNGTNGGGQLVFYSSNVSVQSGAGVALLTADVANSQVFIGTTSNGVTITSAGGVTLNGTARSTKKIRLTAEYAGAVLDTGATGNNTGSMTSGIDVTNRMNYYKWTTTQGTNQTYDIAVQVPIPTDFSAWSSSTPLSITAYTTNTTNGTVRLEARSSTNVVEAGCNFVDVTPGSVSTWATNTASCSLTGTYTAGDYMTLRIRLQSPTSGDVRVGNITLNYLSNK